MRFPLLPVILVLAAVSASAQPLPWLKTSGTQIVDVAGKPVQLRGINLGGWLVQEMWMAPFKTSPPPGSSSKPIRDHVGLWRTLENRLGSKDTDTIRHAYRDAWLNEGDFAHIHNAGFNCIRLPFLFDQESEPSGLFFWLDRALEWAKRNQIYVILDMHGAPGRQSDGQPSGEEGRNRLFHDPEMVEQTVHLWVRIAQRYRDRPEVAGYDLLNEPMGALNSSTLYLVQDRLYREIRKVDARHIVLVEDGYKGLDQMPFPGVIGWSNVAYSLHSYNFGAKQASDHIGQTEGLISSTRARIKELKVPMYLGEFNIEPNGSLDVLRKVASDLDAEGWSWSLWTYKVAGPPGGKSLWGLYYSEYPLTVIDPFADSLADILNKCKSFRSDKMTLYTEMQAALQMRSGK